MIAVTNPNTCAEVVHGYLEYLSSEFTAVETDHGCVITTPFTRPDGEFVEIAVEPLPSARVKLTDMGDTLGYLYVNGLTLSRNLLDNVRKISRPLGISVEGSALVVRPGDVTAFGSAFHQLLQSVLSVTEMIQKRRPTNNVRFDSEVETMLIASGNTYDTDFRVSGSRSPHIVRFHIDGGRNYLIQPIAPASEAAALSWSERWAYRFRDIIDHDDKWQCFALLDDRGSRAGVWTERTLAPINEYKMLWSEKDRFAGALQESSGIILGAIPPAQNPSTPGN